MPDTDGVHFPIVGREARRAASRVAHHSDTEALIKVVLNWVADTAQQPLAIVTIPGDPPVLTVATVEQDADGRLVCRCPDAEVGDPCWHTIAVGHTLALVEFLHAHQEEGRRETAGN